MSQLNRIEKNHIPFIDYMDILTPLRPPSEEDIKLMNERFEILRDIINSRGIKFISMKAPERIMTEEKIMKLEWGLVIAVRSDPEEILRFWGFEKKPNNIEDVKLKFLEDTKNSESFKLPEEIHRHVILREATEEELVNYTDSMNVFEYKIGDEDIVL